MVRVSLALSHVVDLDALHFELVAVVLVLAVKRSLQIDPVDGFDVLSYQRQDLFLCFARVLFFLSMTNKVNAKSLRDSKLLNLMVCAPSIPVCRCGPKTVDLSECIMSMTFCCYCWPKLVSA